MSSQLGMLAFKNTYTMRIGTNEGLSDGIARVHGMNNVQAEELVEYVFTREELYTMPRLTFA